MKRCKILFIIFICLALIGIGWNLFFLCTSDDSTSEEELASYIEDILPSVLKENDIDPLLPTDTVVLGDAIPCYYVRDDILANSEVENFPLFINGKIYSIVRRGFNSNGERIYSCRLDARGIYNIDATEGALVYHGNRLYMISPDTVGSNLDILAAINHKDSVEIQYVTIAPQKGTLICLQY